MEIPNKQPQSSWPVHADMVTEKDERIQLWKPDRLRQICLFYPPSKGCTHKNASQLLQQWICYELEHTVQTEPSATGSQQQPQASGSPSTGAFHRGSRRLLADNSCSRPEPFLLCSWWAQHCPCLAQLCRSLASMLTGDGLHRQAGGITEKGTHWDSNPFPKGTATKQPQPQPCSTCSQAQPCSWPADAGAGCAPPCASQLPTLKTAFQA